MRMDANLNILLKCDDQYPLVSQFQRVAEKILSALLLEMGCGSTTLYEYLRLDFILEVVYV